MDEGFAQMRRMTNLPQVWQKAQRIRKGVTPSEVVYEEDRLKLLHYVTDKKPRYRTPLVFVYALVNRPYILDLKSLLEGLPKPVMTPTAPVTTTTK